MSYNNFNNSKPNNNNHQSYPNNLQSNNQPKKWSIPQIKYRHIEDVQ